MTNPPDTTRLTTWQADATTDVTDAEKKELDADWWGPWILDHLLSGEKGGETAHGSNLTGGTFASFMFFSQHRNCSSYLGFNGYLRTCFIWGHVPFSKVLGQSGPGADQMFRRTNRNSDAAENRIARLVNPTVRRRRPMSTGEALGEAVLAKERAR